MFTQANADTNDHTHQPKEPTMTNTTIHWDTDDSGIVTLTMDDPASPVNTMNDAFRASLHDTVEKLTAAVDDKAVTGVIITSAKKTFFAGGDITLSLIHI